jgi:cytochrome c biogenesis protein ResB
MVRLQKWLHLAEFVRLLQIFKLRYLMNQKIFRLVADLRFSIFILLLVFCSIAGTIIEQDQSIEVYKINYFNKPCLWILNLGSYSSIRFRSCLFNLVVFQLNILFGLSLVSCTFLQSTITKNCTPMSIFQNNGQFYRLKFRPY